MKKIYYALIACFVLLACDDEEKTVLPIIENGGVTDNTYTSAVIYGKLSEPGNQLILKHGFVWKEDNDDELTMENSNVVYCEGEIKDNTFSYQLTDLEETKSYFFRSFVEIEQGIFYSEDESFIAKCNPVIESASPLEGVGGTIVTLTGENFTADKNAVKITFGDKEAKILEASENKIVFEVPDSLYPGRDHTYEMSIYDRWAEGTFYSQHYFTLKKNYVTVGRNSYFGVYITSSFRIKDDKPAVEFLVNDKKCEASFYWPHDIGFTIYFYLPENLQEGKATLKVRVEEDINGNEIIFTDKSKGLTILPVGTWAKKQDAPDLTETASFEYNGYGYVVKWDKLYKYNSYDDSWEIVEKVTSFFNSSRVCIVDDKMYTLSSGNTFQAYHLTTGDTQTLASFHQYIPGSSLFAVNGEIYLGWGYKNKDNDNSLWKYDMGNDKWVKKTSYPGEITPVTSVAVVGDKVRIDNYIYDPSNDTYTKQEEQITCGRNSIYLNDKLYFIEETYYEKDDKSHNEWKVKYYDLKLKEEIEDATLPISDKAYSAFMAVNGKIYVGINDDTMKFFEFTPAR